MTAPAAQPMDALVRDDLTHISCCEHDGGYALCGSDLTLAAVTEDDVDCAVCLRRDELPCAEVCPDVMFGSGIPVPP